MNKHMKAAMEKAKEQKLQEPAMVTSEWDVMAWINFEITITVGKKDNQSQLKFIPKGAKIPRNWVDNPDNAKMWEAIKREDTSIIKHDLVLKHGKESRKAKLEKLSELLSDEYKALLASLENVDSSEYTNFLEVIGRIYLTSKQGNDVDLKGIFLPSFDIKQGREYNALVEQIHLLQAIDDKVEVKFECTSIVIESTDNLLEQDF